MPKQGIVRVGYVYILVFIRLQSFCSNIPPTIRNKPIIVEARIGSGTAMEMIRRDKKGTR